MSKNRSLFHTAYLSYVAEGPLLFWCEIIALHFYFRMRARTIAYTLRLQNLKLHGGEPFTLAAFTQAATSGNRSVLGARKQGTVGFAE